MEQIKIGQIGVCHEHAAAKIATLKKMPEIFAIVGVVDDRGTSLTPRFAGDDLRPYKGLPSMTEEELLDTHGLQAVTVETPNLDLVRTAARCVEHGLAIHMDKPGGDNLSDFAAMRKRYEARRIPFQMGYMFRGNPAIQWCIRAAREGWLGDIFEVQASISHDYGGEPYQEYLGKFPGGIMFNLGCHLIDFIVAMLGAPEKITPFLKSAPGDSSNNNCLAVLEYSHAIAMIRACSREVNGIERRYLKICGTKGSVELCPLERFDGKPLQMRLMLREGNEKYEAGTHIVDFGVIADRYEAQLLHFAQLIRGQAKSSYDYEHDYLTQKVLLAAAGYTPWSKS